MPADRPLPAVASHRGGRVPLTVPADLHRGAVALAGESRTSVFMVLQAALAALLTRLGAGDDIPLGTPVAGRGDDAVDQVVGFFVNTLVLRTDTSGDPTFRELLDRVRDTDLSAYDHQDLPFEHLVDVLSPTRSLSHNPLFQVLLSLDTTQQDALAALTSTGLGVRLLDVTTGVAKLDLALELAEHRDADGTPAGLVGAAEYSADLFDEGTVALLVERFLRLLAALVADPGSAHRRGGRAQLPGTGPRPGRVERHAPQSGGPHLRRLRRRARRRPPGPPRRRVRGRNPDLR
ncbi:condensation domain-containing protein [Streptomyces sp. UP1A-1]|nr:condensation domain-containing protein [Streptomyces sp. UP1A-1]